MEPRLHLRLVLPRLLLGLAAALLAREGGIAGCGRGVGLLVQGIPVPKAESRSPWRIAELKRQKAASALAGELDAFVGKDQDDGSLVIHSGDVVYLRHLQSRKVVDVDGIYLRARRNGHGTRQAFTILKQESGEVCGKIYAGDRIFLRAHTGMVVGVKGEVVTAADKLRGPRQELLIEVLDPSPAPLRNGATVFLRTHTGLNIEIFGDVAKAQFDKQGASQAFILEKPRSSY